MSGEQWYSVDEYLRELLVQPDPALDAALEASAAAGLPAIHVSPVQGQLLHVLARAQRAKAILEIGTLGGYSAIWLGRALPPDGRLITIEVDRSYALVARGNIQRAGLAGVIEVRVGPALERLPELVAAEEGPFDLIFIDADKPNSPEYFAWSLKLARRGTMIIVDNVVRGGAIVDPSTDDPRVVATQRLLREMGAAEGVVTTALQTVGTKGYDGFAVALVTAGPESGP